MINYLDYLSNPTPENIRIVHDASGMTQIQISEILGIGLQTYKGWLAPVGSTNHRKPNLPAWNLLLFELQARQNGYQNLLDFF